MVMARNSEGVPGIRQMPHNRPWDTVLDKYIAEMVMGTRGLLLGEIGGEDEGWWVAITIEGSDLLEAIEDYYDGNYPHGPLRAPEIEFLTGLGAGGVMITWYAKDGRDPEFYILDYYEDSGDLQQDFDDERAAMEG